MAAISTESNLAREIVKALGLDDIPLLAKVTINIDWSRGADVVTVDIKKLLSVEEAEELNIVLKDGTNQKAGK